MYVSFGFRLLDLGIKPLNQTDLNKPEALNICTVHIFKLQFKHMLNIELCENENTPSISFYMSGHNKKII